MGPGQLAADDGELAHGGVNDPVLQSRIVREEEPKNSGHDQKQREERQEAVVGDECCQRASRIVAELPYNGDQEREHPMPLLECIQGTDELVDLVHWPWVYPFDQPGTRMRTSRSR